MVDHSPDEKVVDVSAEGRGACGRIEHGMARLDNAIQQAEAKLANPANAAKKLSDRNAALSATEAQKPQTSGVRAVIGEAAKAAGMTAFDALTKSGRNRTDREIDLKYGMPFEAKLQRAHALGIKTVDMGGGVSMPIGTLAHDTRKDIELAKSTAALVQAGHSTLVIPKNKLTPADARRGCAFASAIIECAKDVRDGVAPRYAVQKEGPQSIATANARAAQAEMAGQKVYEAQFKSQLASAVRNPTGLVPRLAAAVGDAVLFAQLAKPTLQRSTALVVSAVRERMSDTMKKLSEMSEVAMDFKEAQGKRNYEMMKKLGLLLTPEMGMKLQPA